MAVFKCKMCGGDLDVNAGVTVVECEYCGTKQTVPSADNEKKVTLFGRANRLRFVCEFDKAAGIYESIVAEFPEEAEAYWGLVLCKYGIEYVDDPATAKKMPTCHRSSFDPVLDDSNFELVMENADAVACSVYREEAKQIEELRKGIIEVSSKEAPYDIFICYKETDINGDRTIDSVIAQDVYNELTSKGYRVFFSRITLEDKLGQEYEPYIFAALNSAKIMLAFGTTYEYYNAVWVKNEWSRFLQLIAKGEKKTLIPCYKDIDAYDMPKEFAHLQAQDMGKVGAIQDLLRGIEKILPKESKKAETIATSNNAGTAPILKRAFMFLEDSDWKSANEYCEKVLDIDPECAEAYLGKLMIELRIRKQDSLRDCDEPFDGNNYYQKALRFADDNLKTALVGYIDYINTRNETAIREAAEEKERCEFLFKEYKAALKNERIEKSQKDKAVKDYHSLTQQHAKLSDLKNNWPRMEDDLRSRNEKLMSIKAEVASLEKEEANLGFFAVKEKKEIKEKLRIINSKHNFVIQEIEIIQREKQGYQSIESLCNTIENIKKQIEDYEKTIEEMPKECENNSDKIRAELSGFAVGQTLLDRYDKFTNPKVGDYIFFGAYEQDNDLSNGKEDIEWLVLDVKDGRSLVISKYILDCKQYHEQFQGVTWDTCYLRKWLNADFLNDAFTDEEKHMIQTETVSADDNPRFFTYAGNTVRDQLFILSIKELNKYLSTKEQRACELTNYASANGGNNGRYIYWWLRTPGKHQEEVMAVEDCGEIMGLGANLDKIYVDGGLRALGAQVNFSNGGVRPAMWIDPMA